MQIEQDSDIVHGLLRIGIGRFDRLGDVFLLLVLLGDELIEIKGLLHLLRQPIDLLFLVCRRPIIASRRNRFNRRSLRPLLLA